MRDVLEKILESNNLFLFQIGMRATSLIHGNTVGVRFIFSDDRWWHVLVEPAKVNPNWIRIKLSSLNNWIIDLDDPATAGITLDRVSLLKGSTARFVGSSLLLEDGSRWAGTSRHESLDLFLTNQK